MANASYVESLIGSLPADQRSVFKRVFDYLLMSLTFGPVVHQTRAGNHGAYYLTGTTHATANTEFSIAHGMAKTPYMIIPVVPVNQVGAKLAPLTVTRAADGQRLYFSSSSTSATVWVICE